MYTSNTNKFSCVPFPKWLYTLVKAQDCKKVALKKMHDIFTWKYLILLMPERSHEKKC